MRRRNIALLMNRQIFTRSGKGSISKEPEKVVKLAVFNQVTPKNPTVTRVYTPNAMMGRSLIRFGVWSICASVSE
jgi:hypothetical protein